jgi:hypothetical protein
VITEAQLIRSYVVSKKAGRFLRAQQSRIQRNEQGRAHQLTLSEFSIGGLLSTKSVRRKSVNPGLQIFRNDHVLVKTIDNGDHC